MATAPVSRRLNLTRDQLATFLTDQQQIRQFELLLAAIDALAGQIVSAGQVYAGPPTGSGLPSFRALQKSDLPASALTDLDDVDVTTVVDGQLLRYDGPTQKWVNSVGLKVSSAGTISTQGNINTRSPFPAEPFGLPRVITVDGRGNGSALFLVNGDKDGSTDTNFYANDAGITIGSPSIRIASGADVSINPGYVNTFRLSGSNGFLSLSPGSPPTPTAQLDINNNTIRLRNSRTPSSATASGNKGDICWDTSYIYVCVATNTWKRTAISTW